MYIYTEKKSKTGMCEDMYVYLYIKILTIIIWVVGL